MNKKVSIQGYEGSFNQMAAQKHFGKKVTVLLCGSFRDVIKIAKDKKSEGAVMAIESLLAGSNFKYAFQADVEFEVLSDFYKSIEKLQPLTESLKVYGVYKNGNKA